MKKQIEVHGHYLNSIRAESGLTPRLAIAELVDNAVDAGATTITLTFDSASDTISIIDDGIGCPEMARFFDLGSTTATGEQVRIGRYGVGGTKAAAALCDTEHVSSIHSRVRRHASISWTDIAANNLPIAYDEAKPEKAGTERGTIITLIGDRKRCSQPSKRSHIVEFLRRTYTPAILDGLGILVDSSRLSAKPFPELLYERVICGEVFGKTYRARVGVLADERSAEADGWSPGFWVACSGRMVSDRPYWDCAEDWGDDPIWAYIELEESPGQRWDLDTHKAGFAERDDLFGDFVPRIHDLLEQAHEKQTDVELRVVEEDGSSLLAAVFNGSSSLDRIREKRNARQGETGTAEPADTGRRREKASKADPTEAGSVVDFPGRQRKQDQSWKMKFTHMGNEAGLGRSAITAHSCWMTFNLDNSFVSGNRRRLDVLAPLALSCIWDSARDADRKQIWAKLLPTDSEIEFGSRDKASAKWLGAALIKVGDQLAEFKAKARRSA